MKCRLLCGFLVLLAVSEWWLLVSTWIKSPTPGSDFAILYAGAKLANENPLALYDSQAQFKIEQKVLKAPGWEARFLYPPFFASAIRALGRMSYVSAYWTWTGVTILLYILSVELLICESRGNAVISILAAIACPAFHWLMLSGQTTVIGLFIFVLIYIAIRRHLDFTVGVLIALLGYRPQFMILLAPICLLKLPRTAFFGFAATLCVLFVEGAVDLSPSSYARYLGLIREMADVVTSAVHPLGLFISAYGLLRTLSSETVAMIESLVLTLLLGYWLFAQWPSDDSRDRFSSWFASLIVATLLSMSYSLIYDLLLILPVIVLASGVVLRGPQASALAVLYCAPIVYFFLGSSAINLTPIALAWLFIAIDRASPESYRTVVDVKAQQNTFSS